MEEFQSVSKIANIFEEKHRALAEETRKFAPKKNIRQMINRSKMQTKQTRQTTQTRQTRQARTPIKKTMSNLENKPIKNEVKEMEAKISTLNQRIKELEQKIQNKDELIIEKENSVIQVKEELTKVEEVKRNLIGLVGKYVDEIEDLKNYQNKIEEEKKKQKEEELKKQKEEELKKKAIKFYEKEVQTEKENSNQNLNQTEKENSNQNLNQNLEENVNQNLNQDSLLQTIKELKIQNEDLTREYQSKQTKKKNKLKLALEQNKTLTSKIEEQNLLINELKKKQDQTNQESNKIAKNLTQNIEQMQEQNKILEKQKQNLEKQNEGLKQENIQVKNKLEEKMNETQDEDEDSFSVKLTTDFFEKLDSLNLDFDSVNVTDVDELPMFLLKTIEEGREHTIKLQLSIVEESKKLKKLKKQHKILNENYENENSNLIAQIQKLQQERDDILSEFTHMENEYLQLKMREEMVQNDSQIIAKIQEENNQLTQEISEMDQQLIQRNEDLEQLYLQFTESKSEIDQKQKEIVFLQNEIQKKNLEIESSLKTIKEFEEIVDLMDAEISHLKSQN
ncbi:centrosomal protein [Anaeramoeba ignava]|uniref:Centrosomal protein n=1 Tax=Anaeramoeba ignava TaxID=1746090 RepID=A0A9Q0LVP7_ANAIG|nr:centrosomal protein [Anaeramoeba ignava]